MKGTNVLYKGMNVGVISLTMKNRSGPLKYLAWFYFHSTSMAFRHCMRYTHQL